MKVFVVNGLPTSGKTTFEQLVVEEARKQNKLVLITSIINIVKSCANTLGWEGAKNPADRKFLSDLKDALEEWKDIPYLSLVADHKIAKEAGIDIMFIDAREPKDIERIKKDFNAKSILVHRDEVFGQEQSNHADSNVYETAYDYIIYNNADLQNLRNSAILFLESLEEDETKLHELFHNMSEALKTFNKQLNETTKVTNDLKGVVNEQNRRDR
jgi:molybdopterin-guanine dinucleotide biosynthesis protein